MRSPRGWSLDGVTSDQFGYKVDVSAKTVLSLRRQRSCTLVIHRPPVVHTDKERSSPRVCCAAAVVRKGCVDLWQHRAR